MAHFYQPQLNPVYCGVASAVIVLNALTQRQNKAPMQEELAVPVSDSGMFISFPAFSQVTFLGKKTEHIKRKSVIEYRNKNEHGEYKPGLSLVDLAHLIEAHGFPAIYHHPSQDSDHASGISAFKGVLNGTLLDENSHLIIHFRSDLVGGVPQGHISPIAAFDEETDSVLILDVAGHKGPWYWAPITHIYRSMAFTYDTQPQGGGYIIVSQTKEGGFSPV